LYAGEVPRSASKNAEAREKTQNALLEAAATVIRKLPADELLSQVKVRDVAKEAGVSTAAIYHYWTSQEAFRRALAEYMLEPSRFRSQGELTHTIEEIEAETERTGKASIRGATRVGARANIERVMASESIRLQMGLWAKHDDEDVAELMAKMYRSLQSDFIPLFEGLVALEGRRFREPFTVGDFAVATAALTEGFTLRWSVDPDAVPTDLKDVPRLLDEDVDPEEPLWDLYSACLYFIAACMTEPAGATDPD
jgi:AcrR family transcriptional regulator